MNYILQLNAFYRLLPSKPVSPTAQCLYCYLMHRNSELAWLDEFTATNTMICGYIGLSRVQLDRARMELVNKGYIIYKKGKGNQCGKYLIVRFDTQSDTQTDTQTDTQSDTQLIHKVSTLNKQNKTKQNKTKYTAAENARASEAISDVCRAYETYIGIMTPTALETIDGYISDGVEPELIITLIEYAAEQGKRSWRYVKAAINGNLGEGIKTLSAYKRKQADRVQNGQKSKPVAVKKSKFNNYEDTNEIDYAALEEKLFDAMEKY